MWWRSAAHQSHHNWEIISHRGFWIWEWVREIQAGLPAAPLLLAGFWCFKAASLINALLAAAVQKLCEYLYENVTLPSSSVIEKWAQQQDAESQLWSKCTCLNNQEQTLIFIHCTIFTSTAGWLLQLLAAFGAQVHLFQSSVCCWFAEVCRYVAHAAAWMCPRD